MSFIKVRRPIPFNPVIAKTFGTLSLHWIKSLLNLRISASRPMYTPPDIDTLSNNIFLIICAACLGECTASNFAFCIQAGIAARETSSKVRTKTEILFRFIVCQYASSISNFTHAESRELFETNSTKRFVFERRSTIALRKSSPGSKQSSSK